MAAKEPTTMRYLVRQCPSCKALVRIQIDAEGKICYPENCKPVHIYKRLPSNSPSHASHWIPSKKTVTCLGSFILKYDGRVPCYATLQVRKFTEII